MDHPTLQQGPSSCCAASPLDGHSLDIFDELGRVTVSLREEERSVFLPSYRGVVGATKAASRFNERLQHRLEIKSRAADDLEHVGSSGLLPKRLAQLLRARLYLIEQPPIPYCNHRLVGKGCDEFNLLVGEWPHCVSPQGDDPNRRSFSQERDAKKRTKAATLACPPIRVFRIGQSVGDVNDFAFEQDAPGYRCSVDSRWVTGRVLSGLSREPIARFKVVSFALRSTYDDRVGLAKARRRFDECVEHRLQIEGRAADHLEHICRCGLLLQ